MRTKIILFLALIIPLVLAYKAFFLPGQLVWGDAPYFPKEVLKTLVDLIPAWTNRGHNFGGPMDFYWAYPILFLWGVFNKVLSWDNAILIRVFFYFPSIILAGVGSWWYAKKQGLNQLGQFFTSFVYSLNTYILLLVDGGQVGVALAYGLFPFGEYLLGLILLSVADFRIALIYLLFQFLLKPKTWIEVLKRLLILVGLHAYWWYPMLKLGATSLSTSISNLQLTSLLNSLLLYQPHWPLNDYGKTTQPLFYFALIPILILSSKKWRQILIFLIFAFLAKGESAPLGSIYSYILNHTSFIGPAFRDSTKFFIPLVLLAAVLIGTTVQKYKVFAVMVYFYLLLLVYPALTGQLQGVLAGRQDGEIRPSQTTGRVLWFDQKPPLGYESKDLPALDAKRLVENRIFASYNVGTDIYNFFSQDKTKSYQWLKLLDAKTFGSEILATVVGSDDIGDPLASPAIYVEDGKTDLENLLEIDGPDMYLVFNHKSKLDLQMAFLQKYFISPSDSQWAVGKPQDYLGWKYELLIRGLDFKDFFYDRNIYYSTQKGEKLKFNFKIPKGSYYFAVRRLKGNRLEWEVEKQAKFEIVNNSELDVVNVAAIVPEEDWVAAGRKAETLVSKHKTLDNLSKSSLGTRWLVLTDSFHPRWQLLRRTEKRPSLPVYSAANAFYLGKWDLAETKVFFSGQDEVRWGALYSVLAVLLLIIYYLYRDDQKVSNL